MNRRARAEASVGMFACHNPSHTSAKPHWYNRDQDEMNSNQRPLALLSVLVLIGLRASEYAAAAFVPATSGVLPRSSFWRNIDITTVALPQSQSPPATRIHASLASIATVAKTTARSIPAPQAAALKALLAAFATLLVAQRYRGILYPGSSPDPSYAESLPPGKIGGCPWIGNLSMYSNLNKFFSGRAAGVKDGQNTPRVWKMFGFGRPMAVVSGSSAINRLLKLEFKKDHGISQATDFGSREAMDLFFGSESMTFETGDAKKYRLLQRLVGQSLTPESVARGMPSIQKSSEEAVNMVFDSDTVDMEDICKYFTLDVAWRQIIGLNLKGQEEIKDFHMAVKVWLKSLTNFLLFVLPFPSWFWKSTKAYKAKQYLNRKIEERIDELESHGADGSTMSAMVFSRDDEDKLAKLTRKQVIDNTNLLIVAGSETSSNTLTNAMLLLGMHPDSWDKLVAEQDEVVAKRGEEITKSVVDNDCPYLDAVVRETMRILPISGGGFREVDDTIVLDGFQIPKKWWTMYSVGLTHEQDPKTWKEDGSHMDIGRGFRPERWLNDETRPTTEFMPFGAGHRFCLGQNLAIAEMKTFLATMARKVKRFDLINDVDNIKWKEGVILTPKDGVVIAAHGK